MLVHLLIYLVPTTNTPTSSTENTGKMASTTAHTGDTALATGDTGDIVLSTGDTGQTDASAYDTYDCSDYNPLSTGVLIGSVCHVETPSSYQFCDPNEIVDGSCHLSDMYVCEGSVHRYRVDSYGSVEVFREMTWDEEGVLLYEKIAVWPYASCCEGVLADSKQYGPSPDPCVDRRPYVDTTATTHDSGHATTDEKGSCGCSGSRAGTEVLAPVWPAWFVFLRRRSRDLAPARPKTVDEVAHP